MVVSYVRQTAEFSPFLYLHNPQEFDNPPSNQTFYKNILFFLSPSETESKLYIRSVGYERSDPAKALINRFYSTSTLVHYVVGGQGTFNGKPVHAGDCFVAFNDLAHSICTDPDDPLEFFWLMIRHNSGDFSLENFGFNKKNDIFPFRFEPQMRRIFHEMMYANYSEHDAHCFMLSKMYELLSYHKQDTVGEEVTSRHVESVVLAKRMWEQTGYSLSVQDVAKSLGFSRKHFSQIFLKETGLLPQRYLLEHKISSAQLRIDVGDNNFKVMAFQLGYKDYPSFSRAFKRMTGQSPREYYAAVRRMSRR